MNLFGKSMNVWRCDAQYKGGWVLLNSKRVLPSVIADNFPVRLRLIYGRK